MEYLDNTGRQRLGDALKEAIGEDARLSIIASYFTVYAYSELKEELSRVRELRFVFDQPTFLRRMQSEKEPREWEIQRRSREIGVAGTGLELTLSNSINQRALARECAEWARERARFRTARKPGMIATSGSYVVENPHGEDESFMGSAANAFTLEGLGYERRAGVITGVCHFQSSAEAAGLRAMFEGVWNNQQLVEDVTGAVIDQLETLYRENPPELVYFLTLYDLVAIIEGYQVFSDDNVRALVDLFLEGADRDRLDPILDACTALYKQLETDDQIKFKSAAKAFVRTYGFLGAILPYGNADWERLSIFLNLLIPKLPSPKADDLSEGILEAIDLESYRNKARNSIAIKLPDEDAEIGPVPTGNGAHIDVPEMDPLSVILSNFNDLFGNIDWNDADNVRRQILEIPAMVSRDEKYQNAMRNTDEQSARMESDRALFQVILDIMGDNIELFKQYQDNPSFKKWLSDLVFNLTYNREGKPYEPPERAKD